MSTEIPVSAVVPQEVEVSTSRGFVKVRTLKLSGLFKVIAAIRRSNINEMPVGLSLKDMLSHDEATQLNAIQDPTEKASFLAKIASELTPDKKLALSNAAAKKSAVIVEWILGAEKVLPAFLSATTNLSETEVGDLSIPDAMLLAGRAMSLLDVRAIVEAGAGFFSEIGALMGAVGEKAKERQPSEPAAS